MRTRKNRSRWKKKKKREKRTWTTVCCEGKMRKSQVEEAKKWQGFVGKSHRWGEKVMNEGSGRGHYGKRELEHPFQIIINIKKFS